MRNSAIISIRKGEIQNKGTVRKFFESLADGKWLLEADNSKKRTNPQNRYLHGILIPEFRKALLSVGYNIRTDAQAKEVIKAMFLKRQITNEDTGEVVEYIAPTSGLNKEEMGELIDEVIRFAAENMSYVIPYPGEQLTIHNVD